MLGAADIPGLRFAVAPALAPSPLRSDVGGFFGLARRGPIGRAVRLIGWRDYLRVFGPLVRDAITPYSVRGYFENGGQIAHVIRLAGSGVLTASATMVIGGSLPPNSRFIAQAYTVRATSPGAWGEGIEVAINYRLDGLAGVPELDVTVRAPDEPLEQFTNLDPRTFHLDLESALIEIAPLGTTPPTGAAPGPRRATFEVKLAGGQDDPPGSVEYQAAVTALGDVPEVAIVAVPDLHHDLPLDVDRYEVLRSAMRSATDAHDRLVLIDAPPAHDDARTAIIWFDGLRGAADPDTLRSAAAYHPPLWILDPVGGPATPQRLLPPSGLIAGVISRLDRERGAHHTPANAAILQAVDTARVYEDPDAALIETNGVNLLLCRCGRGMQVWGGRTLEQRDPSGRFVAHRRLIHRLVRAIRRVAEPLAFDSNTPVLWLALTRAITSVLLEAFRAGALKGERAEEAFRVQCDAKTNPPETVDLGQCVCLISVAPAVPLEFITLRIAVSADGQIEVT